MTHREAGGFSKLGHTDTASTGSNIEIECESVVLATQRLPRDEIFRELRDRPQDLAASGIEGLYQIGDCRHPSFVAQAIFSGHRLGREIDSADPSVALPLTSRTAADRIDRGRLRAWQLRPLRRFGRRSAGMSGGESLARRQQLSRISRIAKEALDSWGLGALPVRTIHHFHNTTLKVGNEYVLRVSRPGYQSDDGIESELRFIAHLRDADLPVPTSVPTNTSATFAKTQGHQCVLFEWIPGPIRERVVWAEAGSAARRTRRHYPCSHRVVRSGRALPPPNIRRRHPRSRPVGEAGGGGPFAP